MNKEALVKEAYDIFSVFGRPKSFVKLWEAGTQSGDLEKYDSEQLLQSRSRRELQLDDVASSMNPLTDIDPEGMAYFMPRVVELLLDMDSESRSGYHYLFWFVIQFQGADGRLALLEKRHFEFLCTVLVQIQDCCSSYLAEECVDQDFQRILDSWKAKCA